MHIGTFKHCLTCGKEFYSPPSHNAKYCSSKCCGLDRKGKPPPWLKPLFIPQKGIQVLPSGSQIDWDSVSRRVLPGNNSARPAVNVTCGKCHQSRWVNLWNLRRQLGNAYYTGYCKTCWKNESWKGKGRFRPDSRKVTVHGYIKLWLPDHPMADKGGEVYEHRLVMSQKLGRPLQRYEHVHHKNGDKTDNRPENLEILSNAEHGTIKDLQARIQLLEKIVSSHQIPIPA